MDLSDNARHVLRARYLRRNSDGQITETPEELLARVARAVSEAELVLGNAAAARRWEDRFYTLLSSGDFLPNSPTLMNAGTLLGQLSACFVLPIQDTMESIFGTLRDAALVQRTGGGTGFSFGQLRPAGSLIRSTGGTSSGPVSFMKIFDSATANIKQGGKRRGANMGVLPVDHPDIREFIDSKLDGQTLQNFNLSVGITDAFMGALEHGDTYALHHPTTGREVDRVDAREIFRQIVQAAWTTGDPGLIFLDTINRANPTPGLGRIESTNPCGEVPLLANESCNLGSLNLAHFVQEKASSSELDQPCLDWPRLKNTVHQAVRFLDDVLVVNRFPLPAIEAATLANRKIGLGVMGLAELLIRLGIAYRSRRAVDFSGQLMRFIADEAWDASARLANERGVFPAWDGSLLSQRGRRTRNATVASIAPTGTISIIADTSSGIEPLFALSYRRVGILGGQTLVEHSPLLLKLGERQGILTPTLLAYVSEHGSLSGAPEISEATRDLFATALEIEPRQHLRMQAAFQSAVDNAVSKTVNLPASASPDVVDQVYREAYYLHLKGVTIYRYGSVADQVLQLGVSETPSEKEYTPSCDPEECRL